MENVDAVQAIIAALSQGTAASVAVGLITHPATSLLREIGKQWKWLKKKMNGPWMIGIVIAVSTALTYVYSVMPGVEMDFSISAVIAAAGTAVLTRQTRKHVLNVK